MADCMNNLAPSGMVFEALYTLNTSPALPDEANHEPLRDAQRVEAPVQLGSGLRIRLDPNFNNLSARTTTKWSELLHERVTSHGLNFVNRHLTARVANLLLAPASVIPCVIDTVAGLQAGALSLLTFGLDNPTVDFAARELHAIGDLVSKPFEHLLRAINPKARFSELPIHGDSTISKAISEIPLVGLIGAAAQRNARAQYFFNRHILSRTLFALTAIAAVVSRVALAVLAIPVVAFSVLTLGRYGDINTLASLTLRAPALVNDLVMCSIKVLNPRAGESETTDV